MSDSSISSSTSTSGTQRVTGLYSSMDIDAMVSASMTSEQTRIDNMQKDLDYAEWQKEAYQDVNTLVSDFQNKYFSYSSKTSLINSSSFNMKTTTITGTNAVSVTAGSNAEVESFSVLSATKAQTAKIVTNSLDSADFTGMTTEAGKDVTVNNTTIKQLAEAMGATLNISRTETRTVEEEVDKLDENGEKVLDDEGNVVKEKITKTVTDEYITLNVNGKDVEINTSGTIGNMISAINNADAGVEMSYNGFSMKLELEATAEGAENNFTISGNDGLFFGANGLLGAADEEISTANAGAQSDSGVKVVSGTDATMKIEDENGDIVSYEFSSNTYSVAGYTFTINDSFDTANGDAAQDVKMKTDVDAMVERITSFVDDYNELITKLNDMVTEKRSYTYDPLTDKEKDELSDKELEEYEQKAKEGLLYGDRNIRNLISQMRSALNSIETDSGLSLRDIGIGTGNYFTSKTAGELQIDEAKLRSAIEADAGEVTELFTQSASTTTSASGKGISAGIAKTFGDLTSSYVKNSKNVTIANITTRISNYEDRLERLKELFATKEDNLYSQFASLEASLSQMDAYASMFYTTV